MLYQLGYKTDLLLGLQAMFSASHSACGAQVACKATFHLTAPWQAVPDPPFTHTYTYTDRRARLQARVAAEVQVGADVAIGADHVPQHKRAAGLLPRAQFLSASPPLAVLPLLHARRRHMLDPLCSASSQP